MSRIVTLVVGAVLVLLGLLWILQGLDVIGGSGMSGHGIWAVIGLVVGAVGVLLLLRTLRTPPLAVICDSLAEGTRSARGLVADADLARGRRAGARVGRRRRTAAQGRRGDLRRGRDAARCLAVDRSRTARPFYVLTLGTGSPPARSGAWPRAPCTAAGSEDRDRELRTTPWITPVATGVGAFGVFYAGALVARRIPFLEEAIGTILPVRRGGKGCRWCS